MDSNRLDVEILVAHYPPSCSMYNPIEHRLFLYVTRACRGVIFQTLGIVQLDIAKTETTMGLSVKVSILDNVYETDRKCAVEFKRNIKIVVD